MFTELEILEYTQATAEKEFDIVMEALSLTTKFDSEEYYTESAWDSIKNFFKKIYDAIKNIIDKVKKTITDLFNRETVEKKIEQVEEVIKKEPEVGKIEIKHKDYKKLKKLNDEVKFEIVKAGTVDELDKKMKKYRNQRNALIGGSALVVGTVATVCAFVFKSKDSLMKDLAKQGEEAKESVKKLEDEVESWSTKAKTLEEENLKLKARGSVSGTAKYVGKKVQNSVETAETKIAVAQQKASAVVEVTRNFVSDTVDVFKTAIDAITDKDKPIVTKGPQVFKAIKKASDTFADTTTGVAYRQTVTQKPSEIEAEIEETKKKVQNFKNRRDKAKTREERNKFAAFVKTGEAKLEELKIQLKAARQLSKSTNK